MLDLDRAIIADYKKISNEYLSSPLPTFDRKIRALIIGLGGSSNNVLSALSENCKTFYRSMNVCGYNPDTVGDTYYCIPERWPYFYLKSSFPEHFEEDLKDFIQKEINQNLINTVFVVSGLGHRGTGALLTETVVSLIGEVGLPCISIISLPFLFQGNQVLTNSLDKFKEIQKISELTLCFPFQEIVKKNNHYTLLDAFKIADLWMSGSICAIINGARNVTVNTILSNTVENYVSLTPHYEVKNGKEQQESLETLRRLYCWSKVRYNLSFRDRINIALGGMTFPQICVPDDVKKLSEQELFRLLNSLKKPWWNCLAKWIESKVDENNSLVCKCIRFYLKHM